jgi:hypothetical protein
MRKYLLKILFAILINWLYFTDRLLTRAGNYMEMVLEFTVGKIQGELKLEL